jgi:hypothetical protein
MNFGSIPGSFITDSGAHTACYPMGSGVSFLRRVNHWGLEDDPVTPSSFEIKNTWSYTSISTSSICAESSIGIAFYLLFHFYVVYILDEKSIKITDTLLCDNRRLVQK